MPDQRPTNLPHLSVCPMCQGYGIRDSGARCKTCGGCGELFDFMKFSDYQAAKKARERNA